MGNQRKYTFSRWHLKGATLIYMLFNVCFLFGQVETVDSLKNDSISEGRIKLKNKKEFQPLDSIKGDSLFQDSTVFETLPLKKSPQRATLYSAILPGLGQAYNGKYWKIPIIYSIFSGMFFLAHDNHQKYLEFKDAYINFDDPENKPVWINSAYQKNDIKERKDFYKRNRDLNIIFGGIIYLLNILDANVDAHLMDFDIGEDLSLNVQPDMNFFQASQKDQNISGFGIKFVLSLHK
ncbi:MAG: DUF5683 domain-containing protein [Bacteroidales bacterium]|nr:DUF5683 domain-containing protein [Bacteroidales bacterium]